MAAGARRVLGGVLAAALALAAMPARAQDLEAQLQEIRVLVREKRYTLALEGLSLVARQLQVLRTETVAPAFPSPAAGWSADPPQSLLEESEIWSNRIAAMRSYVAAAGSPRIDLTIDVHSPFGPAMALSFNPLSLAGDPRARVVEVGGEKGLLRFNADTGEGELHVLVGRETLVTARGRGLAAPEALVDLARGVDYTLLRERSLR